MDAPEDRREPDAGPRTPRTRRGSENPNAADPAASALGADRLSVLAHELSNLLDGSIRCLNLAERSLPDAAPADGPPDAARQKLDTVRHALRRMTEIVDAAMRPGARAFGPSFSPGTDSIELGEAVFHAVDVLTPRAGEHGIRIRACVSNGLAGLPAGPLYTVVVNGLTNAIDAVIAAGHAAGDQTPQVEVAAEWTEDGRVRIAIRDRGAGLGDSAPGAPFRFGYSTKRGGAGIGLAVASEVVSQLAEGSISLRNRTDGAGAVLEVLFRPVEKGRGSAA